MNGNEYVNPPIIEKDDDFAVTYSNIGPSIDIVAPGTNIISTYGNNSYAVLTGTSMAAPYVTGALAKYMDLHPTLNSSEVISRLLTSGSTFQTICNGDSIGYYSTHPNKPVVPLLNLKALMNYTH
jgi:subtilisin family serine protease